MSGIIKLLLSMLGVAGASAGGIGVYKMYDKKEEKEKISERLKSSLLRTTGTDDDTIWGTRVSTLKSETQTKVVGDLWEIKDQSDAKDKLKSWCISKVDGEYLEGSMIVDNVKKYCTYNMKDKLTGAIEVSGSWETAKSTLKGKGDTDALSDAMKKIKDALNGGNPAGTAASQDALKDWCSKVYEAMYEDNQDFKDASTYCVTNVPSR
ncbi:hypothetical protein MHF_0620 [Mycoplasma haemofelis Ohio2]|uniref:Uncharacterized protein n=1 Tax=Mycoplasma haemofelis (strain Ohio2) TaxID=859194 RepID=F6FI44_MYCHI|nr:hypothetical protein MHF_0620 [Mycoplasma haemofelis Ohio2]